MDVLDRYQVEELVGYGTFSLVFRALDRNCHAAGIRKDVALKFVWNFHHARQEASRLERAQSVFEICRFITYEEVPAGAVRAFIGESLEKLHKVLGFEVNLDPDQKIGVLVLELVRGKHLIDRAPLNGDAGQKRDEWLVRFRHPQTGTVLLLREWLLPVARALSLNQRLDILIQLTRALAESHENGVVHGDLNPWNLFYNPRNGRITLIDLGWNHFGVQGWRTPEHRLQAAGLITVLPPAADMYLIGKWMSYLLPKRGPWRKWRGQCLHKNAEFRPGARFLLSHLESCRYGREKKPKLALPAAILLLIALAPGWRGTAPFSLNEDGFNRIAVMVFEGSTSGLLIAEMVSSGLDMSRALESVPFSKVRKIQDDLPRGRPTAPPVLHVAESLGAALVLSGKVNESERGTFEWKGTLSSRTGTKRELSARGISQVDLSDNIVLTCLKLLDIQEKPNYARASFSPHYHANVLYSEAGILLAQGKINAAFPLLERILQYYDPHFPWARIRLAQCYLKQNELVLSEKTLKHLLEQKELFSDDRLVAACYTGLAHLAERRAEHGQAIQWLTMARRLAETSGMRGGLLDLMVFEGRLQAREKGWRTAEPLLIKAGSGYRDLKDHSGYIHSLCALGSIYMEAGLSAKAREVLNEALVQSRRYGLDTFEAMILMERARADFFEGKRQNLLRTLDMLERARALFRKNGNHADHLRATYYLALNHKLLHQYGRSRELLGQVYEKTVESGEVQLQVRAALSLSDLEVLHHEIDKAELLLNQFVDRDLPANLTFNISSRLWKIYADRGQSEPALKTLRQSLALAQKLKDERAVSYALNNLGELWERRGQLQMAMDFFDRSLALKKPLNDAFGLAWTLRNKIMVALKQGDTATAEVCMSQLSPLETDAFRDGLLEARLLYEKGEFEGAVRTMEKIKGNGLHQGRWRADHEKIYLHFRGALRDKTTTRPPEQFGN